MCGMSHDSQVIGFPESEESAYEPLCLGPMCSFLCSLPLTL